MKWSEASLHSHYTAYQTNPQGLFVHSFDSMNRKKRNKQQTRCNKLQPIRAELWKHRGVGRLLSDWPPSSNINRPFCKIWNRIEQGVCSKQWRQELREEALVSFQTAVPFASAEEGRDIYVPLWVTAGTHSRPRPAFTHLHRKHNWKLETWGGGGWGE